jgi:tetratricopeptide (TPR) repeat protein
LCQDAAASPEAAPSADEWAARARLFVKAGSVFEALDAYDQAVNADPARLDLRLAYAGLLKDNLFWLRGAGQYRTVLAAEPDNITALMGYGELLTAGYQFEAAAEQYNRVLKLGADGTLLERARIGLGTARFGQEDYVAAQKAFAPALESHPDSPTAMAFLAISSRKLGDLDGALKLWERLLALDPGAPPARIHRNEIEELKTGIAQARHGAQSEPGNAAAWELLGRWLRRQPDLAGAEEALTAAVRLAPGIAAYRFQLGAVQRDLGRWDDASASFSGVGKDRRLGALALYNLAHCRRKAGDRKGEADAWGSAVALNAGDVHTYERYIAALRGTAGFDLEKARVTQAVRDEERSGTGSTLTRVRLAVVQRAMGDTGAARRAALDALRLDPNDVHAQRILRDLIRLDVKGIKEEMARLGGAPLPAADSLDVARTKGALLMALGRDSEAEAEFRKVLAAEPSDARALVALASCVKARDGLSQAIPLLESARRARSDYLYANLDLALVLLEASRLDESIATARAGIDLAPDNPLGYAILGSALRLAGDLEKASRALEEAVALDPMDYTGAPRLMLAKIYGAMGRDQEAIEALKGDMPEDPDEIYHLAWVFVRDNFKDQTFHGQDWRAWEHRFDGQLRSTSGALGAVALMLSSLEDRNTRLRSADQTARLLFSERSGAPEYSSSGMALSNSRTVEVRHLDDGVGYIAITNLDDPTVSTEVKKAVESVSTDTGVILDLRGNQGGADNDVARITGMFVKPGTKTGTIVAPDKTVTVEAEPTGQAARPILPEDKPVVVLVDRHTASSAESLAGSLKESHRAVLVGEKTFGKSGIQMPRLLPGGTIALIVVADRGDLQGSIYTGVGVKPDMPVEGASRGGITNDDPAMNKAREILRKRKPRS